MSKKKTKTQYRLRNWKEYTASLVERGSLTIWISDEMIAAWQNHERSGQPGRPRFYSEMAIECLATVGEVYHQPLRATEGLMRSLTRLLGVEVPVPDYSTLSRRRKTLAVSLPRRAKSEPLHLVVDSSGVKIYGEGEWKVRQHGYSKRRTWRKLHLAVDEATHELVAAVVTTNNVADSEALSDLLDQVDETVEQVSADGAYDKRPCYEAIKRVGARATIPPRRDARIWRHGRCRGERVRRDENLRRIRQVGRAQWKRESGYHRRSLAETAVFRFKMIFGERVRARSFEGQAAQVLVRCAALNRMTHLGMPDSYAV